MFFDVKESETKLTRSGVNKIGKLNFLKTADISTSPIGVGLEKADAGLYDPSYAYPYLKEIGAKWVRMRDYPMAIIDLDDTTLPIQLN
ncbi:MAG: hypothetical protein J6Q52_04890 [Clostridia bacterium]|nr:hypothetical protein [Clostridia bacterium]